MEISTNSPVSAFAVYTEKKANNTSKRNQQRQRRKEQRKTQNSQNAALPKPVANRREDDLKNAWKKLKELQQRAKDLKNIANTKSHKKKAKGDKRQCTVADKKSVEPKRNSPVVASTKTESKTRIIPAKETKAKKSIVNKYKIVKKTKHQRIESTDHDDKVPVLVPAKATNGTVQRKRRHSQSNSSTSSSSSSSSSSTSTSSPTSTSSLSTTSTDSTTSQESFEFEPVQTDSIAEGMKVFRWMLAPYNADEFLKTIWEKKPLYVARKKPKYYKDIMSTPIIDDMLRKENIQFTKNMDVTSYVDGKRETHNPIGRAHPHVVWDYYLNGCSVRLLNPQTYLPKLCLLNATLQEFFNSFVGANAYLTPPMSQGFAPHYDDIEAFILQIEGKKHWKVYKPLSENDMLPRNSSKNFDQSEIGDPILEVTLEAGDMLYFPRGYIHQGETIEGAHSLHITVSMYQRHSWADLFEKMIPAALQAAINENVELRRGLPFDIYDNFGLVNSDVNTPRKKDILEHMKLLCDKIKNHLPIDTGVDDMAREFQHAALPPVLTDMEKCVTVFGDSDVMRANGKVVNRVEISLDTRIRLLRKNIIRMAMEEDGIRLYYSVENSLEYHGNELQYLEIDEAHAPAIETLIMSYPEYVFVENLDVSGESEKLQVANDLWEKGLIMTEYPMDTIEED